MANYNLEKYKELQAKVRELQKYLFMTAKPMVDADFQNAVNIMSANCPSNMDALAPDPFDADVEMLHTIGRTRGIVSQTLDLLDIKLQTFIDLQKGRL